MAVKIKKGDKVIVIAGKDKGKEGVVLKVLSTKKRLVVQGVNVASKHERPSQTSAGGVVKRELSLDVSNVALVDPKQGKATKVGFKFLEDGKKVRYAKLSGEVINN